MMKDRVILPLLIVLIIIMIALVGCTPKLPHPTSTPPTTWLYDEAVARGDSTEMEGEWWESFADTSLNRIVVRALEKNRDIFAAAARVEAAQQSRRVARAEYLPSLAMKAEAEATYTHATKTVQEYTIEPEMEWELSLFGALRSTNRQARAEIEASEWALRAMQLSIAAEVASTYFTLRQAQQSLAFARHSLTLRRDAAQLIDSLYYYGMSDGVARDQARSLVYTALADVCGYRRAAAQSRLSLCTLMGENPDSLLLLTTPLATVELPATITLPLPSTLLERRPDIQQSLHTMDAAAAAVGIARAARFPTISLTASGGLFGYALRDLTHGRPWAWSASGEIAETIFNFGGLRAREREARAEYEAAMISYEGSMLTAFEEVEQALVAIETYGKERTATRAEVEANAAVLRSVNALYQNGMNDYLNVIDAEREWYSSQMEAVAIIASQQIAYVSLFKALGGEY